MGTGILSDLFFWLPELILSGGAMAVLIGGVFARRQVAVALAWLTVLGAGLSLASLSGRPEILAGGTHFFGAIVLDPLSLVFRWLALGVIAFVVLMAQSSADVEPQWTAEYLGLLLAVGVGLMLMAEANHLLMAYLSMELVSLGSYVLVGFGRDARSSEASLKYLLFGALASGIMLFGMSWVYGLTRSLSFPIIQEAMAGLPRSADAAVAVAMALLIAGLAFKISMVPFHMWTPDVYEGAPIPVTAMLSVGPKAAGIALLLRIAQALGPAWSAVGPAMMALTIVTMTLGNLVAVAQRNVKRLLAYSTIAQVGYLLIGITATTSLGLQAILVYLVAYLFMNLGAFACVVAVWNDSRDESLEAFRGLARRNPVIAFCLTLFLLSLAGLPPFVGFIGKFLLFGSAIDAKLIGLAVAGVINSAIALYYYVNIIRLMYLEAPAEAAPLRPAPSLRLALLICGSATLLLGIFPGALLDWLHRLI